MRRTRLTILAVALLAAPAAASAQDFMFGTPRGALGVRVGANLARAGSEVFDFTREHLTVGRGDFRAVYLAGDVELRVVDRLDLVVGLGYSQSSTRSELRDFVDLDDLPIEQETVYRQVPLTVGLKGYLLPRGRPVGRLAWVPAAFAPYLGAGTGAVRYAFEQTGDFVEQSDPDLPVFTDHFTSSGWAPQVHGFVGADVGLSTRAGLSIEARYTRASAEMDEDFVDFDDIDLSGLQTTLGVFWRF